MEILTRCHIQCHLALRSKSTYSKVLTRHLKESKSAQY
nr:MAG TPA_asm: hypothetical protein [Caudoviricetes sp.]